jgi:hypothetical protein
VRVTIDNLDGLGAVEYTGVVAEAGPITVQRVLNAPSRCTMEVLVDVGGLALPVRRGRVVMIAEDAVGTVLFTGYIATGPVRVYAGEGLQGAVYTARVMAVSDEWLLDKAGSGVGSSSGVTVGLDGRGLLARLAGRLQTAVVSVATSGAALAPSGVFAAKAAAPWSVNAGAAASGAYAAYRALNGTVTVQPAAAVTHALSDADGTLSVAEFATSAVRELANDVTVSGEEEPAAYVQETFQGDGTTTVFALSEAAFKASQTVLLRDSFGEAAFDATQWVANDPGSKLSLTSAGLTVNGGTGVDGATSLTALEMVEMGGSVVVEMGGVLLSAGSDGMLGGMYAGLTELVACFAGFRVRQNVSSSGSVTELVPVVNGSEVGTVFTPTAGHAYTLRMRLYCVEMQRVGQVFNCMVDGVVETFGSAAGVAAAMDVVFELVDEGASSNTPATVLYDSAAVAGPIAGTPTECVFVAVNSTNLYGSMASVAVTRPGSAWVVSTLPSGVVQTRLTGSAGQGVDCEVSYGNSAGSVGKVTFFAGREPVANERVDVLYRVGSRSVARIEDAASVAAEVAGGGSGTARWLGKVLEPVARSSADCENAAAAILSFASSQTAAIAGKYTCVNPAADVWPGDVLRVTSGGVTSAFLVRSVVAKDGGSSPETRWYGIEFANDWATELADGLGLRLSEEIAADAVLPQTALSAPAQVLANLQQLTVVSLTETALGVDAGTVLPPGWGSR